MTSARSQQVDRIGLAGAVTTALAWGLTGVFVRSLPELPPAFIVAGRLGVALAVLLPIVVLTPWPRLRAALMSPLPLAMSFYYLLATEAFVRAPMVEVTLIIGLAPAIAVGLEWVRGRAPSLAQLISVLIAFAGLVLYLAPTASLRGNLLGDLFAFGSAAVSAVYAAGVRANAMSGAVKADPMAMTASACLWGGLMSAALMLLAPAPIVLTPVNSALLVGLGLVSTALPTLTYGLAAARLSPVLTTAFSLLTPVSAGLFGGLILGEWPVLAALPGAAMTIAGLFLLIRSNASRAG